jgi:glycosyltransferase involved in cell wall biosynthesis
VTLPSPGGSVRRFRFAIVLQTPRDRHSAVFITYEALAADLRARGHEATILTPTDVPSLKPGRWTPLVYPVLVARWLRAHRGEFDAVVFHSYAGWWAIVSGAARGHATVVAFHGLEPMYHAELRRESVASGGLSLRYRLLQERFMPFALARACRRAGRVLCFNSAERAEIVRRRWTSADRISVVAHGVPDAFLLPLRPVRPARTLLFVGQWLPMKGTAYLAAAFDTLAARHPDLELVCAGTLRDAEGVLAAFGPAARGRVSVLPRLDRSALIRCYRDADLFVFPSLYEGFGLAVLEAMAAALPIVTTRVGIATDALRDDDGALLVPGRDPAAIVTAVERLLGDAGLRERLSARARALAEQYRERERVRELADLLIRTAEEGEMGMGEKEGGG